MRISIFNYFLGPSRKKTLFCTFYNTFINNFRLNVKDTITYLLLLYVHIKGAFNKVKHYTSNLSSIVISMRY